MSFFDKLFQPDVEKLAAKGDVDGLIKALRYKRSIGVRVYATNVLGRIGDARAVEPIIAAFSERDKSDAVESAMLEGSVVSALANIGTPAIAPLIVTLKDSDEETREVAMLALAKIGTPAIVPLVVVLGDENESVGDSAEKVLAKIGVPAVKPLIVALKDSDAATRALSAQALGEIKDARAVEPLIAALQDTDELVRIHAAEALRELHDVRAVDALVTALDDRNEIVRVGAAQALGQIGDARAVEPLITALRDTSHVVRRSAAWALGQLNDVRAMEPLRVALEDGNADVRKSAELAMSEIGGTPATKRTKDADLYKLTRMSDDYTAFAAGIAAEDAVGNLQPQLCLCCKELSMAKALAAHHPSAAAAYLIERPEVIAFPDGQAAVRFMLKDGPSIIKFFDLLGQGDYGTTRLVIKGGIAPGLPVSDRLLLMSRLGHQVLLLGETFAW